MTDICAECYEATKDLMASEFVLAEPFVTHWIEAGRCDRAVLARMSRIDACKHRGKGVGR